MNGLLPLAYIDPSSGFQMFSPMGPFFAFLLALLGVFLAPVKNFFKAALFFIKKNPFVSGILFLVLSAAGLFFILQPSGDSLVKNKVIVLGMDGLDPDITEQMMERGELPNFKKLKEMGVYHRLQTVSPPQSPVAWSTFATGLNPGEHGLFDFLWRHTENYMPDLALSEFKKGHFVNRRSGIPFWKTVSEHGIPATVIHCPVTFPPEKVSGAMLSGMGVPDLRGTQGTFTFYSSSPPSNEKTLGGIRIHTVFSGGKSTSVIQGPLGESGKTVEVPIEIEVSAADPKKLTLKIQGQSFGVGIREWSDWIRIRFPVSVFRKVEGMARFYWKSEAPDFELYLSPVQFTPENPAQPISYPGDYAKKLKQAIGDFHTLGMPHDTWALNEGAMDEDMFLEQSRAVIDEETKILKRELAGFKSGLLVFVIETPDRVQHMFWRALDKQSPLYDPVFSERYGRVIPDCYKKMDEILGLVMKHLDDQTTLMVVSDHGFKSFRRAVHLNSWLRDNDFMKSPGQKEGAAFFKGVDWSRSQAYAVGLGSIYLNLRGREKEGIVEPGKEAAEVKTAIIEKLRTLKDQNGTPVVHQVYRSEEVFHGLRIGEAPDLMVAFEDGYRASWQTALGAAPESVIEDNLKKWSGDHILDASLVPGIFFSNRPFFKNTPSLYDLAPAILSLFDLKVSGNPAEET